MVFVFFSDMVRPADSKTFTMMAIILAMSFADIDTIPESPAYNMR